MTQFGLLTSWMITNTQTSLNGNFLSFVNLRDLNLENSPKNYLSFKIGVERDAAHVGGINIFGKSFGDFPQNIIVKYFY